MLARAYWSKTVVYQVWHAHLQDISIKVGFPSISYPPKLDYCRKYPLLRAKRSTQRFSFFFTLACFFFRGMRTVLSLSVVRCIRARSLSTLLNMSIKYRRHEPRNWIGPGRGPIQFQRSGRLLGFLFIIGQSWVSVSFWSKNSFQGQLWRFKYFARDTIRT